MIKKKVKYYVYYHEDPFFDPVHVDNGNTDRFRLGCFNSKKETEKFLKKRLTQNPTEMEANYLVVQGSEVSVEIVGFAMNVKVGMTGTRERSLVCQEANDD